MTYSVEVLADILRVFIDHGVDFVVIGGTVVELALKRRSFEGDIDLFVVNPSVLVEEELYRSIAEEHNWGYSTTEVGTPRLIARTSSGDVVVELYENFMDIHVPEEILARAKSVKLGGVKFRVLHPEQYFVLKARQGVDLDKLSRYAQLLKRIDQKLIRESINCYPRDEQELIAERLRSIGLRI